MKGVVVVPSPKAHLTLDASKAIAGVAVTIALEGAILNGVAKQGRATSIRDDSALVLLLLPSTIV